MFFPVTNHHIVMIQLPIHRNNCYICSDTKPERDKDKWINIEPMKQLASDIINSVQIILSPEAKTQQEKALANLSEADRTLVKEFAPIKWI